MADDAALLRAVLTAPNDDAPRLAYAQWSEDQRDAASVARAALIREQIELARMNSAELLTPRAFELEYQIKKLIDGHGRLWAGVLTEWVDTFHFLRGFVGWISLSARNFLEHGQRIMELAPVQHVDLTGVRDVDEALFNSPLMATIQSLSMDHCGLYDLHMQMLAASPQVRNLRWLSVAGNNLTIAAAEALAASPYLRDLRFAEFRSNPSDPVERLRYDSGIVVSSSMPPAAREIEMRFGPQAWLHREEDGRGRFDN